MRDDRLNGGARKAASSEGVDRHRLRCFVRQWPEPQGRALPDGHELRIRFSRGYNKKPSPSAAVANQVTQEFARGRVVPRAVFKDEQCRAGQEVSEHVSDRAMRASRTKSRIQRLRLRSRCAGNIHDVGKQREPRA